jgi:hypothetical protein
LATYGGISHGGTHSNKPTNITGSYEVASSIDRGNRFGSRKRQDSDSDGSQESIISKSGGNLAAVIVQTTHHVSSNQDAGGDSWHNGRRGLTRTSVLGGKAPKL